MVQGEPQTSDLLKIQSSVSPVGSPIAEVSLKRSPVLRKELSPKCHYDQSLVGRFTRRTRPWLEIP